MNEFWKINFKVCFTHLFGWLCVFSFDQCMVEIEQKPVNHSGHEDSLNGINMKLL